MTITTVDSPSPHLHLDAIPVIDLRLLSQSDLASLSLCSQTSPDHLHTDDLTIPKIDRSVFNESAGSRKQTYSRLRLAPRKPDISVVGRSRYNPVPKAHTNPVDDPERKENKEIVSILRDLFGKDSSVQFREQNLDLVVASNESFPEEKTVTDVVAFTVDDAHPISMVGMGENVVLKRKRGRPRKDGLDLVRILSSPNPSLNPSSLNLNPSPSLNPNSSSSSKEPTPKARKVDGDYFYENMPKEENVVMEIVNKNGVVVDLAALACCEDPYGPELRRRSVGLETEEELLGFLRELKGQWGSRRKKRKVVEACDFGDALPIDWKILISIRRKEGKLSLYCRRYISPTGQQFVSCKEVSSYLLPFFGFQAETEDHPNSFQSDESDYEPYKLSSGSSAGLAHKDRTKDEFVFDEASPSAPSSSEHEKQLPLLDTENLAEVEIRDLLECHLCKTNFDEKDAYLQHLLSSHQKNAKRSRQNNISVCDGVIIRDGKYECQFCHKIFDERHRYNGHVGTHVRNYVRSLEHSPGETTMQKNIRPSSVSGVVPGFSGLEASADIDKISAPVASIPSNEISLQSDAKPPSVGRVLSGFYEIEAPDNIDKGSVPSLTDVPSNERSMLNNVKPSSVSGGLPGFSKLEASTAIEKGLVPLTSVSSSETMQNNLKPLSVSEVLSGESGLEAPDDIDRGSLPPTSTEGGVHLGFSGAKASAVNENGSVTLTSMSSSESMQNNIKASSASKVPFGESLLGEPHDIKRGSHPLTSTLSDEGTMHSSETMKNNIKASSVSKALPGESGLEASDDIERGSLPLTSTLDDERTTYSNASPHLSGILPGVTKIDASSLSGVLPGFSRVEAAIAIEKSSAPLTSLYGSGTMQNNHKPSVTKMLPAEPGLEVPDDFDGGAVPPTSIHSNGSTMHSNVSLCLNEDPPRFSEGKAVLAIDKSYVPLISMSSIETSSRNYMKPSSGNMVLSGFSGVEVSADVDKGSVPPTLIFSNERNVDSPRGKLDADSNTDILTNKPSFEHSTICSNPDTGIYVPQSVLGNTDVEIVDSPRDNLRSESIPENTTSVSNFDLNADSPCSEQDIGVDKISETLDDESGDTLNSNNGMTDSDVGRVDRINSMNVEFRSCSSSTTSTCNSVEDGIPETLKRKDASISSTDDKLGMIDQTNNYLDGDFGFCLGSATALPNNVGNGRNTTVEENDIFTRTAVGTDLSDLKQGEGSFSFSIAPSRSEKSNGLQICSDELFSLGMKDYELDRGKGYGFSEPERCFGTNINQPNGESLIASIGNAEKDIILQRLVADTSSSLLQPSGCFPTLDLMSNMGHGESGNFSLQKFDNMSGFDELGFDELEPSKFGFMTGKQSGSLTQEPMDLAYDSVMEEALNTSVQFEWEPSVPKIYNNQQQNNMFDNQQQSTMFGNQQQQQSTMFVNQQQSTMFGNQQQSTMYGNQQQRTIYNNRQQNTICVWCRIPFNLDALDLEMQSDSVGFMCPTCKAKILGQLNVFGQ